VVSRPVTDGGRELIDKKMVEGGRNRPNGHGLPLASETTPVSVCVCVCVREREREREREPGVWTMSVFK
jgi:hypothetical protein